MWEAEQREAEEAATNCRIMIAEIFTHVSVNESWSYNVYRKCNREVGIAVCKEGWSQT